jgi:outer membrane protein assembly factor BamD
MIQAYTAIGEEQLAADARRVLTLNRDAGRFEVDEKPEPATLGRKLWDYIGLDKN